MNELHKSLMLTSSRQISELISSSFSCNADEIKYENIL
jgi:hypothetical protein